MPAGEDDEVVVVASPPSLSESKSKTEDRRGPIDGRSQNVGVNRSQESKQPKDRSDAEVVQNVEVHVPALKDQFVATDGSRRNSGPRDSPDELQGEVTVNSCPSPVIRTRRTAGDFVPEQSPSDIRPTIFESRRSDPRFDGHKLYFEAKYVQWGDWVVSGEKTIEMSANKAKGTIEVESTDDPDSVVKVPLERITNAQRGKEPNRGVCLRMTRIEGDPCDRMLIEMSTQRDQERFCNVLGQMTKVTEKER